MSELARGKDTEASGGNRLVCSFPTWDPFVRVRGQGLAGTR